MELTGCIPGGAIETERLRENSAKERVMEGCTAPLADWLQRRAVRGSLAQTMQHGGKREPVQS